MFADEAATLEEAQEVVRERASDEKLIGFVPLDQEDAGMRAIGAVLDLSIEAADAAPTKFIGGRPAAEEFLFKLFMAGVKYGMEAADGTTNQ